MYLRVCTIVVMALGVAGCQSTGSTQVARGPAKGSIEWAVQGCYGAGIKSGEPLKQCLEGLMDGGSRREVVESSPGPIFVNVVQPRRSFSCSKLVSTIHCS